MADRTFPITETSDDLVNVGRLRAEIEADCATWVPVRSLVELHHEGGVIYVEFDAELDAGHNTSLNNIIAAHVGYTVPPPRLMEAVQIFSGSHTITSDASWQRIGGVITDTWFFNNNSPDNLFCNNDFEINTDGATVQARIVEKKDGESDVEVMPPVTLPDTSGAWAKYQSLALVEPRKGPNVYEVQAKLNGTLNASIRSWVMSLMRTP